VFTADMISADEALRLGLFNRVVDDQRLMDETLSLAARIAAKPPLAVGLAKQALRQGLGSGLSEALDRERNNQLLLFKSADARAAMRAFLEKRTYTHGDQT
jgi:enoyl-CoA hydratase/carnithine racemase